MQAVAGDKGANLEGKSDEEIAALMTAGIEPVVNAIETCVQNAQAMMHPCQCTPVHECQSACSPRQPP